MSRYIDADLIEDALIEHGQHDKQFKLGEFIKYRPFDVQGIIDKDVPTADVRENVKGEWIRCKMARMDKDESIIYYRNWKCNVCGYASNEEYDYCPYCGARMR